MQAQLIPTTCSARMTTNWHGGLKQTAIMPMTKKLSHQARQRFFMMKHKLHPMAGKYGYAHVQSTATQHA